MDLRLDLLRHYRWLRHYGLNDSHSGNLSVRSNGDFWITPGGACADSLEADQLVRCVLDAPPPEGASLDAPLHRAVYQAHPEANCVMHSHGPHSLAATFGGQDFEPVDFEGRYYFTCVPVLDIPFEDYLDKAPQQVAKALARSPVVVVRGHGVYSCAATLDLAYKWTCSLESSARLAWMLGRG